MIPPAPSVMVFHQIFPPTPNAVQFASPVTYTVGGEPQAVAVADLDRHGFADIAVATTPDKVSVLLQTAAGALAPPADYPTRGQPPPLKAAALPCDATLDLLPPHF